MRVARNALLALFNSQLASPEKMDEASAEYFGLIQGVFNVPQSTHPEKTSQDSTSENQGHKKEEKKEKSGQFLNILLGRWHREIF